MRWCALRLPQARARLRVGRGRVDLLAPARGRRGRGGVRRDERPRAQRDGVHRPAADPRAVPHLSRAVLPRRAFAALPLRPQANSRDGGTSSSQRWRPLLPALIPFGTIINGTSAIDSFALQMFGTTESRAYRPRSSHATTLIVALSALLAVVYFLAVTQRLPPMRGRWSPRSRSSGCRRSSSGVRSAPIALDDAGHSCAR